jgi:hypothetical protein
VLACGPSFEAIQEGDLRFAHCDRLDLDPRIAPSHRLHCWREWRRVYTYGQTRDRVDYSQRRIAEVVSGDSAPSFELPAPAPPEPTPVPERDESEASPAPAAFRVAQTARAEPARGASAPAACRTRCQGALESCSEDCQGRADACEACGVSFDACLERCSS